MTEKIIIVGAGISGLVSALLLARQGHRVFVYDKRTTFDEECEGRSINLTISGRGMSVLSQLGLESSILQHSVVLVGRVLHLKNKKTIHYKYGTKKSQVLLSIRRTKLINILLNAAELEPNITFYAGFELIDIDAVSFSCQFLNVITKEIVVTKADYTIGADGVFSRVRSVILKKQLSSFQQTIFKWGYKEYQFNRKDAEKLNISTNQMHMWPKSNALLVAIPNADHTFSVIFTAPLRNHNNELQNFDELVQREFPGVLKHTNSFFEKCGTDPHYYLLSIKMDNWCLDNKIILMGDACHATYLFYGQGMNSALEDAVLLCNHINKTSASRLDAFASYESMRKIATNALHQLSEAHLHQMTKAMISSFWQACNVLDYHLAKLLPGKWIYEYEMIAHSTLSYDAILDRVKKQSKKKILCGFYICASLLSVFIYVGRYITLGSKK